MRKSLAVSLNLALTVIIVLLLVRMVELGEVSTALLDASYAPLVVATGLSILTNVLRAYRWKFLLRPISNLRILTLFSIVGAGYMVNNLFPARLGDFGRAFMLGAKQVISSTSVLATVVLERVLDGLVLVSFLAFLPFLTIIPQWIKVVGYIAIGLFVFSAAILYSLSVRDGLAQGMIRRMMKVFPIRIRTAADRQITFLLRGFAIITQKKGLLLACVLTLVIWLVEGCTYYAVARSLGLQLPLYSYLIAISVINFATLALSTPAGIGPFEYACMHVLLLFSVSNNLALSYAIILHLVLFLPITSVGLVGFCTQGYVYNTIKQLRNKIQFNDT